MPRISAALPALSCAVLFAVGTPCAAAEPRGVFVGDAYRYPRLGGLEGVGLRSALDVAALPSTVPSLGPADLTVLSGAVAVGALFSIPFPGGSLDVRVRNRVQGLLGPRHLQLWSRERDYLIYAGFGLLTTGMWAYGALGHHPAYVESAALMLEAFVVAEVFHLTVKLVTGRQGTHDGAGLGAYEGPAGFFRYFPCGTPSGHVASMMALVSVLMSYWSNPVVTAVLGTFALLFSTSIILDDYHYVSEVVAGAALGYVVGHWVVDYRSSHVPQGWADPVVAPAGAAPTLPRRPLFTVCLPF